MADRVADALRSFKDLTDAQRADLWDMYEDSTDVDDLEKKLTGYSVDKSVKLALWDLKNTPERTLAGFGDNVLKSSVGFVKNMVGAVYPFGNLWNTSSGSFKLLSGGLAKLIPGVHSEDERLVDALAQELKSRYGSFENAKTTAYNDPIGFLSDVSILFTGGGAALTKLGTVSKIGKIAKAGEIASKVGTLTDPLKLATTGTAKVGKLAGTDKLASSLYQSALKPSTAKSNIGKIGAEVSTGIREGIAISEKGQAKLESLIDDLNKAITDEISSQPGAKISPTKVAKRTGDTIDSFSQQVTPKADITDILSEKSEYLAKHTPKTQWRKGPGGSILPTSPRPRAYSALEAQEEKIGTYRQLRGKYDKLSGATIEARKALARGIKEELETLFPEIKGLNEREGRLIDLSGELEKAIARQHGKSIINLHEAAAGVTVGLATESVGAGGAALALYKVINDPAIKSKLAIAINRAQQLNPGKYTPARLGTTMARIDAYLDSLKTYAQSPQPQETEQ